MICAPTYTPTASNPKMKISFTVPMVPFVSSRRCRRKAWLARGSQQFFKVFRDCRDASIAHFASRALNHFHHTFGNLLTDGNPIGDAHQVSVFKLDPWPFVPVVE